jgi:hypothetical protein
MSGQAFEMREQALRYPRLKWFQVVLQRELERYREELRGRSRNAPDRSSLD